MVGSRVLLAATLLAGCATSGAGDCPPVKTPLLTLSIRPALVFVSSDELLDWTSSYESLGGGAGRSFFLRGPEHDGAAPPSAVHVIFAASGHEGTLREFEPIMVDILGERGDQIRERLPTTACVGGETAEGVSFSVDFSTHRGRVPYRIEVFDVQNAHRPTILRTFTPLDDREAQMEMRRILSRTVWR